MSQIPDRPGQEKGNFSKKKDKKEDKTKKIET
jgi:hypothetical protein